MDAREVMARAYYEWATMNEGEESRWDEPGNHQSFALARADVMLAALRDSGYTVAKLEQVALRDISNGAVRPGDIGTVGHAYEGVYRVLPEEGRVTHAE